MLSYQHEYHAGNLADIHKYTLLLALWQNLKQKGELSYIDTHSGRGFYDLSSEMASKTGEWHEGVGAIKEGNSNYLKFLDAFQKRFGESRFPGSFAMIAEFADEKDRLHGAELHPAEFRVLQRNFPQSHLEKIDGWQMLFELLPPKPRRGLVFVDPSYEVKSEYEETAKNIRKALRLWPEATIMLWYPILASNAHHVLEENLSFNSAQFFRAYFPKSSKLRMKGTGIVVIGAPFGFKKSLQSELGAIASLYERLEGGML